MNKIEINKDNYKGYVELYKARLKMSKEEFKVAKSTFINSLVILFISLLLAITTLLIGKVGLIISKYIVIMELLLGITAELVLGIVFVKKIKNLKNKKIEKIKKYYPYVDAKLETNELTKILQEAGILIREYKNGTYIEKINVDIYEKNNLNKKQTQEDFQEIVNTKYIINNETNEQKENPKIKKLVR